MITAPHTGTKIDFIRAQPLSLSVDEVLERAKDAGIAGLSKNYVLTSRSHIRRAQKNGAHASNGAGGLTAKETAALDFCRGYLEVHDGGPTLAQIAKGASLNKGSVSGTLHGLRKKGHVTFETGNYGTLKLSGDGPTTNGANGVDHGSNGASSNGAHRARKPKARRAPPAAAKRRRAEAAAGAARKVRAAAPGAGLALGLHERALFGAALALGFVRARTLLDQGEAIFQDLVHVTAEGVAAETRLAQRLR